MLSFNIKLCECMMDGYGLRPMWLWMVECMCGLILVFFEIELPSINAINIKAIFISFPLNII